MDNDKREQLIRFCISSEAYLNDISKELVSKTKYIVMSDEELEREADWYDGILDK